MKKQKGLKLAVLKRDGYKCRMCGVRHNSFVIYSQKGNPIELDSFSIEWAKKNGKDVTKVTLSCFNLSIWEESPPPFAYVSLCRRCQLKYNKVRNRIVKSNVLEVCKKNKRFLIYSKKAKEVATTVAINEIARVIYQQTFETESIRELIIKNTEK